MGSLNMFLNVGKGPQELRMKVKKCDGRGYCRDRDLDIFPR
jgi:hypothetical protein